MDILGLHNAVDAASNGRQGPTNADVEDKDPPETNRCGVCGAPVSEDAQFCGQCGRRNAVQGLIQRKRILRRQWSGAAAGTTTDQAWPANPMDTFDSLFDDPHMLKILAAAMY